MSREPSVVVPGNHDGVHLGHRTLLSAGRARGAHDGLQTVALFFDPHPAAVLGKGPPLASLTTVERRTELLLSFGADRVHCQPFDEAFAAQSPETFVENVLVRELSARAIVVGPDFRFGKNRAGGVDALMDLGCVHGFDVTQVAPVEIDGSRVSSTRIRARLAEGDVTGARRLLGRVPDVAGRIVRGDQRGRTIGFPTANLDCEAVVLPKDGVYAVVAKLDGEDGFVFGVANLGVRPTFAAGRSVEVHLFDFDRDVYDRRLRVGFLGRVRAEQKFDGPDALVAQIEKDAEDARRIISSAAEESWRWL
jgi:riboflavin kinase/FMN adenylyltransferase